MISNSVLHTDLYQLTMLQGYFKQKMNDIAVFEFFVRRMPKDRAFLVAAGLEQVLDFLQEVHFTSSELEWLQNSGRFSSDCIQHLARMRFIGDVHAMPEGTLFFPNEPILRITAPIAEAQLVESRVINFLHFQTIIASKAARSVLMAPDKLLVDFGFRRAHGGEAGLLAARASYLAGFSGSATVSAGQKFQLPMYGTMAHSFVQAHQNEQAAFEHFAQANPDNVVLLIDTYDTELGAQKVVELAPKLQAQGIPIKGVRLDSGDLGNHAFKVRNILDHGGLKEVKIFASSNIDEYELERLMAQQAPIDGFGIGTRLDTSADAPYLDCAYKLQEYAGIARRKRSEGKTTWPGRKQVYRRYTDIGKLMDDTITIANIDCDGEPLLQQVMQSGKRIAPSPPLEQIRQYCLNQLGHLPHEFQQLRNTPTYPVKISSELQDLAHMVDENKAQL